MPIPTNSKFTDLKPLKNLHSYGTNKYQLNGLPEHREKNAYV